MSRAWIWIWLVGIYVLGAIAYIVVWVNWADNDVCPGPGESRVAEGERRRKRMARLTLLFPVVVPTFPLWASWFLLRSAARGPRWLWRTAFPFDPAPEAPLEPRGPYR